MKSYGRKTKQKVGNILLEDHQNTALEKLALIPDKQLVGHLFSYFYNKNELIKFRSTSCIGPLASRMANCNMERARIVLRRIMWNLNDESGGIGWGSPEAMGEILAQNQELALEFKSILFSYLDPDGNYIEHDMLQRGVLWGIGTYLDAHPHDLSKKTKDILYGYLNSPDPVKIAYCIRALSNAMEFHCDLVPEQIITDNRLVDLFNGWNFIPTRISDLVRGCEDKRFFA